VSAYSTRFLVGTHASPGASTVVVPSGYVWVLKNVDVATSTTGTQAIVYINGNPIWASGQMQPVSPFSTSAHYAGRAVLNAGDSLEVQSSGGVSFQASGFFFPA
jgi:hypothetical protein